MPNIYVNMMFTYVKQTSYHEGVKTNIFVEECNDKSFINWLFKTYPITSFLKILLGPFKVKYGNELIFWLIHKTSMAFLFDEYDMTL